MNPNKNLIEPKPYMNPTTNLIEPKPYMNPTKNLWSISQKVVSLRSVVSEFQPIKSLEITLTITLKINLRLTTFCEIDPRYNLNLHESQ